VEWLEKAASQRVPPLPFKGIEFFRIAETYANEDGGFFDPKRALTYLQKAVAAGEGSVYMNPVALDPIVRSYLASEAASTDPQMRLDYLLVAMAVGNTDAMELLAHMFWNGDGVPPDRLRSVEILRKIPGSRHAQFLGELYLSGVVVERDFVRGEQFLRQGIDRFAESTEQKTQAFRKTLLESLLSGRTFAELAKEMEGDKRTQHKDLYFGVWSGAKKLELMFEVPQDMEGALALYRVAAGRGDTYAKEIVPTFWSRRAAEKSFGKDIDLQQAEAYALKAIAAGEPDARKKLFYIYMGAAASLAQGIDVPKSASESFRWKLKAADLGDPDAQASIAIAYEKGEGVPKDMVQAYRWINIAAVNGRYAALREAWEGKLTPQQVAQGQELSREWKPRQLPGSPAQTIVPPAQIAAATVPNNAGAEGIVHRAIERIRASRYARLPDPTSLLGGSGTTLTIENRTKFAVNVYLKGATIQSLTIAPSLSLVVNLVPGRYQVAAEIPDSATVPLFNELTLNAGTQYRQLFYMSESARE
jgi:TPR repeat protein